MKRVVFLKTALSALALSATLPVLAQEAYPSKPIRFVVPYPPGGPTDLMARLLQPELQTRLGVTVVVDNKSGAGGNLGSAEVAKQLPADGHTLLLAASGPMAVNPSLYKSMAFDPLKDLAPVIQISSFPLVFEANTKLGVKTPQELVALAKRPESKLTFASAGNGTPQHLAGEIFNTQMGISLSHIPYRGAGPALNDMIGGQVSVMFDVLGSSLPHIQAGRLVPLAVTSAKRHPSLPNVPTMMEAGIEGYEFTAWHGIAVRAGTSAAVINKLNTTLNAIFNDAEFKKKWEAIGTPVVGGTPQQFAELIRKDSVRLGEVVKRAGVTVD
ncbi:MAG: tripartite tricarboxylate transporter substrate binding protein [Hydrogenophaga sp.]|uniref:Bug family tripartite tricarboxylate transporter substrate binding protein n=1 Tax=Hydrogenophaga sp. TaxID=1904254 RepID=UPI00271C9CDB|nr:tripartite tricarboxylate transporter substrate binding protein [Hydrogenophaga sp.]MDO9147736.1 tripartite tricarboxylate transporter substrate binding protein [Hydrogenophaga sp.]MDO9603252.1 tripartite tricarboxylate transporter substrate binding protein [Hydrogenophaga sp.]MDP3474449.1 tripartite tricarboxylate transporter substrate binding protein [Hydrogenophaga sp.]